MQSASPMQIDERHLDLLHMIPCDLVVERMLMRLGVHVLLAIVGTSCKRLKRFIDDMWEKLFRCVQDPRHRPHVCPRLLLCQAVCPPLQSCFSFGHDKSGHGAARSFVFF